MVISWKLHRHSLQNPSVPHIARTNRASAYHPRTPPPGAGSRGWKGPI